MKKIASLLLVLVMVLSLTVTAFAAPTETNLLGGTLQTGSITITSNATTGATVNGREFQAIKIMNATTSGSNIAYYVPAGMEDFYKTYFNITDADLVSLTLDEVVTNKIMALGSNSKELFDLGAEAYEWFLTAEGQAAGLFVDYAVGKENVASFTNLIMGYYVVVDVTDLYDDAGELKNPDITSLSAVILRTPGENVNVAVKTDAPPIEKLIDGTKDTDPATSTLIPYNNTSIGDVVPYVVTSYVPNMTPFTDYIFKVTDTMSKGLTYNNDLVVTIGNVTLVKDQHYTLTVNDKVPVTDAAGNVIPDVYETEIVVDFIDFVEWYDGYVPHPDGTYYELSNGTYTQVKPSDAVANAEATYVNPDQVYIYTSPITYRNAEVKLTYSATVNEDAVIGIEGNPNAVTLEYTNDHKDTSLTTTTTEQETKTFTTGVKLYKVDEKNQALSGAEFKITGIRTNIVLVSGTEYLPTANIPEGTTTYYKLISGRYTDSVPTDDTKSVYSDEVWYELNDGTYTTVSPVGLSDAQASYYVDKTGTAKINTYTMAEYENRPVTTTATVNASAFVDEQGVLVFEGLGAGEYTITEITAPGGYNMLRYPIDIVINFTAPTGTAAAVWSGTYQLSPEDGQTAQALTWEGDTGVLSFSVENRAGTELPVTGGMGTTVLYVLGSIMVLGAAVLLITKRRVNA